MSSERRTGEIICREILLSSCMPDDAAQNGAKGLRVIGVPVDRDSVNAGAVAESELDPQTLIGYVAALSQWRFDRIGSLRYELSVALLPGAGASLRVRLPPVPK